MMTSKQRAAFRAQANELETTLMIGKEGITQTVVSQTIMQLEARELVKGKVLETAFMTAREASDQLCEATGAEGIQAVGNKFVIYRRSEKKAQEIAQKTKVKKKVNPVRQGAQKRRRQAQKEKQQRDEYFKQAAIQFAIERRRGGSQE